MTSEKENFSFSSQKLQTLDFSFSSQNRGTGFNISLSLLENGDIVFTFSFSSRSLSIENPFLFLLSKVEHILSEFSFPSRNQRKEFPVSLSPLETGDKNFNFLFLLSIGPFGLSSMTASDQFVMKLTLFTERCMNSSGLYCCHIYEKLFPRYAPFYPLLKVLWQYIWQSCHSESLPLSL